jgi:hypothetical protein
MRRIGKAGTHLAVALALSAAGAGAASAALPELGRCEKSPTKTGEYAGNRCLGLSKTGKGAYAWAPGPGVNKKFTAAVEGVVLQTTGPSKISIACQFGEAEGEYTGPRTLTVSKLLFQSCQQAGAKTVLSSWCQNIGSFRGEVSTNELAGELGYIEHTTKTKVGLDLKAKTGTALALFECGGAAEVGEHGLGTGTLLEVEGSVIGRVKKINVMTEENLLTTTVKAGAQVPEAFEGGVKDTLTTLVGLTKTPAPSTFASVSEVANLEPLEIKAK